MYRIRSQASGEWASPRGWDAAKAAFPAAQRIADRKGEAVEIWWVNDFGVAKWRAGERQPRAEAQHQRHIARFGRVLGCEPMYPCTVDQGRMPCDRSPCECVAMVGGAS